MTRQDPANLLAAALRAQAGGSPGLAVPPNAAPPRKRLPVLGVLLFAVLLGLLAGGIAGLLTLFYPAG
ncbi:hypothetical protein MOQ72_19415 [Saccharopolyspora sp. K220]|uniref:hypothetical protein n=1 Tax=Saccharopolyspora soli TaxID=2926618 RepID=UPI001F590F0E|nr:hypothetical protein [Saccharopolyspora soli]MCI2419619.1 hypothetical protein [Saccharopolyspora soli]